MFKIIVFSFLLSVGMLGAQSSIQDHGVAAPVGQAGWGGVHATVDGEGNRVILIQLWTGSGAEMARRLLVVDAETGETEIVNPPVGEKGTGLAGSFGTFLSSKNRFYNVHKAQNQIWFIEYDVAAGQWTGVHKGPVSSANMFANTFTEDDQGVVYAGLLPNGQLLSIDPQTQKLTDHGRFSEPGHRTDPVLGTDSAGWVYAAMLYKQSDVVAWRPGETEPVSLIPENHRRAVTSANVYRGENGKVYVKFSGQNNWYELFEGQLAQVSRPDPVQVLRRGGWRDPMEFPDGSRIANISVPNKVATILNLDGSEHSIEFHYDSAGRAIYSVETGPDGKIYGSTGIPLRFFRFDPETGEMDNWGLGGNGGHVNDIAVQGDKIYGGIYGTGSLFVFDPSKPWEDLPISQGKNPLQLYVNQSLIGRPFVVMAHPDGDHVLMGGNPYRSNVGGGLVIHQVSSQTNQLITPEQMVKDQGVKSLAALPNGDVVVGTTTAPGTGGTRTAKAPYVLLLDWETKEVTARFEFPGYSQVSDLLALNDTQVFGITQGNNPEIFVLDTREKKVVGRTKLSGYGNLSGSQGSRVLSLGPDQQIYILFGRQIVCVNPANLNASKVVEVPQGISTGPAWLGGRLYFASGPRLLSWKPE